MKANRFLEMLIIVSSISIQAQPIVSLSDTVKIYSEGDSLVSLDFYVEQPSPTAFFQFELQGTGTTAGASDYIDIISEIIGATDTVVRFQWILFEDSLVEGPEEVHYRMRQFYNDASDTVLFSGPTHFVLIIEDNDTISTGIEALERTAWEVFPNPTNNLLIGSGKEEVISCVLFDMDGKRYAISWQSTPQGFLANCVNIPAGLYLLVCKTKAGILRQKVILE